MLRKKTGALRRYYETVNMTGDLDEDSTDFDRDDPLWYQRMDKGKYKGLFQPSLQISNAVESSAILDSGSDKIDPPPTNWYTNLEKYDKSIINSFDIKNSVSLSTNTPPNNAEESISKEKSLGSDSDEFLPPRKRTNWRGLLQDDSNGNGTNAYFQTLEDESTTTEIVKPGQSGERKSTSKSSFLSEGDSFNKANKGHSASADFEKSSEHSYTEKVLRTDKPRNLLKLRNVLNRPTENAFKNLFDEESSSNKSLVFTEEEKNFLKTSNKMKSSRSPNISPNRKRKPIKSFIIKSSHNSSLSEEKNPMESEDSLNSSRRSMKLKYFENSPNNNTQSQQQKSKDLNHSFVSNQSLSQTKINKSESGAKVSLASNLKNKISPVEEQKEISITESINDDIQRQKERSPIFDADRISTSDFENKENFSSFSNRQNFPDNNSELKIDVESRNGRKMDEQTSRKNIDDSSVQTGEGIASENAHTISLEDEESIGYKTPSEESLGNISNASMQQISTSFGSDQSFKSNRIHQKKSSPKNNEDVIQKIDSVKNQSRKPKITNYEFIKPNDINFDKLKELGELQTKENEKNLNLQIIFSSEMSKQTVSRETSTSANNLKISSNNSRVSSIEKEFSRMFGVEDDEIPSTSDGRTHNSQSLSPKNINNKNKSFSQNNESLKDLRRTLDSNEESEDSENLLMTYLQNTSQAKSGYHNDISGKERSKDPLTPKTVEGLKGQPMQKVVENFFKPIAKKLSAPKPIMKPIVDNRKLMTLSELEQDKEKKEEFFKRLAENEAKWRKEIDDEAKKKAKEKESQLKNKLVKAAQNKKKPSKPVDKAYLVNGVVYKPPKLPRPMYWATDRLYKHIWKMIEPKYQMRTRVRSEEFVIKLGQVYKKVMRLKLYKNYKMDLENLMKEMAEMGLIVHRKDFNDFCIDFLPIAFREKATPMLLPGNKMSIPYEPSKLYTPLI